MEKLHVCFPLDIIYTWWIFLGPIFSIFTTEAINFRITHQDPSGFLVAAPNDCPAEVAQVACTFTSRAAALDPSESEKVRVRGTVAKIDLGS